jgi:hypothetical protein
VVSETVESLFVLYRVTGNPKYQEYGWKIWQAIEKYCKTDSAYTAVKNVNFDISDLHPKAITSIHKDSMESFFFAETLKYLSLPRPFLSTSTSSILRHIPFCAGTTIMIPKCSAPLVPKKVALEYLPSTCNYRLTHRSHPLYRYYNNSFLISSSLFTSYHHCSGLHCESKSCIKKIPLR